MGTNVKCTGRSQARSRINIKYTALTEVLTIKLRPTPTIPTSVKLKAATTIRHNTLSQSLLATFPLVEAHTASQSTVSHGREDEEGEGRGRVLKWRGEGDGSVYGTVLYMAREFLELIIWLWASQNGLNRGQLTYPHSTSSTTHDCRRSPVVSLPGVLVTQNTIHAHHEVQRYTHLANVF